MIKTSPLRITARLLSALLVIVAAVAGTLIATAALASGTHVYRSHFAILSTHHAAHIADVTAFKAPAGGVLAGQLGARLIYVRERSSEQFGDEICVEAVDPSTDSAAAACDPREVANAHGVTLTELPTQGSAIFMASLVPNGVNAVDFAEGGAAHSVAAANNVAAAEGSDLESAHYDVNGGSYQVDIPSRASFAATAATAGR